MLNCIWLHGAVKADRVGYSVRLTLIKSAFMDTFFSSRRNDSVER